MHLQWAVASIDREREQVNHPQWKKRQNVGRNGSRLWNTPIRTYWHEGLSQSSPCLHLPTYSILNFILSQEFSFPLLTISQISSFPVCHMDISVILPSRVYCHRPEESSVVNKWLINRLVAKFMFFLTITVQSNVWHHGIWKQQCACHFLTSLEFSKFSQEKWAQVSIIFRLRLTRSLAKSN